MKKRHALLVQHTIFLCLVMFSSCTFLSGCSILSPVKVPQVNSYLLASKPIVPTKPKTHLSLNVMQPSASALYQTTQMAYNIRPYQIAYFAENRWADAPNVMLQALIIQSLQATHYFHALIAQPSPGRFDYLLDSQILELRQDFYQHPPLARFTLRAQLLRAEDNRIIATRVISTAEPLVNPTPYAGVWAMNRAVERALVLLAIFCISNAT